MTKDLEKDEREATDDAVKLLAGAESEGVAYGEHVWLWARDYWEAPLQQVRGLAHVAREYPKVQAELSLAREALEDATEGLKDMILYAQALYQGVPAGTYELCGPKVNGNPEGTNAHVLVRHVDAERLTSPPRDYDGLAVWLADSDFEGIVWHHPDGRMVKLKRRDFA